MSHLARQHSTDVRKVMEGVIDFLPLFFFLEYLDLVVNRQHDCLNFNTVVMVSIVNFQ